jgi:hypothetical protein
MMRWASGVFLLGVLPFPVYCAAEGDTVSAFVQAHCAECHDRQTKEGGLDLTKIEFAPAAAQTFPLWVKVHDRVQKNEMPPADAEPLDKDKMAAFLKELSDANLEADRARVAAEGRASRRRLNRYEYENTLRDLLSTPWLPVKDFLPEDSLVDGFNKVGEGLDVSYVQMARYLKAAEFALREAMAPMAEWPETTITRYYAWDQRGLFTGALPTIRKTFPLEGLELRNPPRRRRGPRSGPPAALGPHDGALRLQTLRRRRARGYQPANPLCRRRVQARTAPCLRQGPQLPAAQPVRFHPPAPGVGGGQVRVIHGNHARPGDGVTKAE